MRYRTLWLSIAQCRYRWRYLVSREAILGLVATGELKTKPHPEDGELLIRVREARRPRRALQVLQKRSKAGPGKIETSFNDNAEGATPRRSLVPTILSDRTE